MSLIFTILSLITAWKVFEKYGLKGWQGIIPAYSQYIEYGMVWSSVMGLVSIGTAFLAGICQYYKIGLLAWIFNVVYFIINLIFSIKKSKAFDGHFLLTLVLIFFPFIGNLYIGFNHRVVYTGPIMEYPRDSNNY